MDRRALVVGNWKMELSYRATVETARAVVQQLSATPAVDVVVCPSFTTLDAVSDIFAKAKGLSVGAQNVHWEEKGPWTGEVSVTQLEGRVSLCIVGHSERRALVGETDEQVAQKTKLLLAHDITPVVCIGEPAAVRDAGETVNYVTQQALRVLQAIELTQLRNLVIAYEPIWAIGTGETPDPDEAAEIMLLIRKLAAEQFDSEAAARLRVVYGGSVSPENVTPFVTEPGVDGVLVGGASLRPGQFAQTVQAVAAVAPSA